MIVSAWNPIEMGDMSLPPCHYAFQVYVNNGKLDLMWQQRSVDVFLGLPYDIAMYGLLLELLAKGSHLAPGELVGQLGDCHLYNNHLEPAEEYMSRSTRALPQLELSEGVYGTIHSTINIPEKSDIKLINYNPYAAIKAELSVGK
jgi:thymidylate synthase